MKLLTSCILFMALLFTSTLHAAREYLQYDILNKTAHTITTPDNASEALAANTDNQILFVRDTTKADASYYIAVFELTRAQAQNLGWTVNMGSHQYATKAAFGEFTNTTNNNLPAPLAYPTKAQWCAYVNESPSRPCNVRYGIGNGMEAFSTEAWYQNYILTGKTACNDHGLYDTFGNVAECTIDDSTIAFQGWYAETTTRFADITRETAETTLKAITDNSTKLTPSAGVRPIYLPPEEQTYSVTVLLDGEVITQQNNVEPGTSITITPPTAKPNYILNAGYTVTPTTITSLTFKMPMENVTFRYTSSAQATIHVTGGTSNKEKIIAGESFTLSADKDLFLEWSGPGITEENVNKNPLTLSLPTITPGAMLTYTASLKPHAILTIVNGTADKARVVEGDDVTLSAPTDGSFSYWTGPGITNSNKTQNPLTLTIGTLSQTNTTLTFEAKLKPAIQITVIDGTASSMRVYEGDTITLTAKGEKWQCFSAWSGGSGITDANKTTNPLTLKLSGFTADTSLTYTASFKNYPRVMVYGGTVTVDKSTNNLGDGYYKVGTKLTLKPHTALPDGYVFSHWLKKDGSKVTTQNYVYTVGALGSTETFTAAYKADDSVTNTNIIYIGNVSETNLTAKTAIGYTALPTSNATYSKNKFTYYGTQEATSDYVQLDFTTPKLNYTVTEEDANSEANRQTALVMKRVKPASGQPYYVGIHEVTNAQYEKVVNGKDSVAQPLLPHVTLASTRGEASTFLTKLTALFGETFIKPTKKQIETISKGTLNNTGDYGDSKITDAMVNCGNDNIGLQNSGAQTVDPYGFYDLWGNAAESFQGDDKNLWGGYYGTPFNQCNLANDSDLATYAFQGAIRAAITTQPRYMVYITNLDKTFYVLKDQAITLKTQVKPGCKFLGWTVKGSTTETHASMPQPIIISANTTLTANFSEELTSLSLTLKNCNGPTTAFPGTTISVYSQTPGTILTALTVSPSDAAETIDLTKGSITFKETATGTVTVTATYQSPKEGFHFNVR